MQLSLHSHRENLNQTTLNRILLCDQKLGLLALYVIPLDLLACLRLLEQLVCFLTDRGSFH